MESDPLLGLTTLIVLLAMWGYFHWLGTRLMGDESHRSSLLAAALGTLLATSLVVTVGDDPFVFVAAVVTWVMVSMFAYRESIGMAIGAGMGGWAVWWGLIAFAAWLAGLREAAQAPM